MNLDRYMTMKCIWVSKTNIDEDTGLISYSDGIEIDCYTYGKNIWAMKDGVNTSIDTKVYLVRENVSIGDKIDEQVIKSVNSYPTLNGEYGLLEASTWQD